MKKKNQDGMEEPMDDGVPSRHGPLPGLGYLEPEPLPPPAPPHVVYGEPEPMPPPEPKPEPKPDVVQRLKSIFLPLPGSGPGGERGCLVTLVLVLVLLALGFAVFGRSDSTKTTSASTSSTSTTQRRAAAGATFAPPDPATLPKGDVLYKGSGGPIGCIYCDGQSRFLPINRNGIAIGFASGSGLAVAPGAGSIVSFGSNLTTKSNGGRYGFAVFVNSAQRYAAGCAIEVGQVGCQSQTVGKVAAGEKVSIIVGEQGHAAARGDYGATWWFVFRPA